MKTLIESARKVLSEEDETHDNNNFICLFKFDPVNYTNNNKSLLLAKDFKCVAICTEEDLEKTLKSNPGAIVVRLGEYLIK